MEQVADVGVIGGSGLYSLLDQAREIVVDTPYGLPSGPVTAGTTGGREVAFLPRHGPDHRYPPHRINYRANLWALRALGVRQILAPCAVGSLRPALGPGALVVPDQLVDRTTERARTFFDRGAAHVSFADPYCPAGRAAVLKAAVAAGLEPVDGGTLVVIDGQRFSTRAESRWYAAQGWSLVNMTALPEAALARELAVCYTTVALVTDLDAGIEAGSAVTQDEVFRVFAEHTARLRALLLAVLPQLPTDRTCPCAAAHDGIEVPIDLP
jgi:5'-methylthioadenosine phosphorylase